MRQHSPPLLHGLLIAVALLAFPVLRTPQAMAITTTGTVQNVHYVAAFQPLFASNIPFSGIMILNFNNGIISGRYTDMSIQPNAPFANRVDVPISGGTDGDNIHFIVGGNFTFNGKIEGDTISGTATYRGRLYQFLARQGMPKH